MAVSVSVSFPTGVTSPRVQVDPVTLVWTGLSPNTTYMVLWNRPGFATSERAVTTDGLGTIAIRDAPQVVGMHFVQLSTSPDAYVNGGPNAGAVDVKPTAVVGSSTSYSVN